MKVRHRTRIRIRRMHLREKEACANADVFYERFNFCFLSDERGVGIARLGETGIL